MDILKEQRNKNNQLQKENEENETKLEELDNLLEERKAVLEKRKVQLAEIKKRRDKIEIDIEQSKMDANHHDSIIKLHLKSEYDGKFVK